MVRGTLPEIAAEFARRGEGRGEITVVVEGCPAETAALGDTDLDRMIRESLARGEDKRSIARELAAISGRPAREVYARAVRLGREA